MKITQIVQETTTSGSVATVSQPIGNMQKRMGNKKGGSMFAGKTTNKPFYEAEISEQDLILVPGQGRRMKPGFISKAADRTDREVEMALGDLFQAAKNAKMTYDMLKDVGEDEGIEGWVQEKIIKASDYLNTIREYLENKRLQSEGTMGALAGGVAGAYLGKSPSAAITGAEIGSELQDTFATEGSVDQLPTRGADYSKYDTDHLKMMLRPGILHRNEARFKALIRKELQKREQQSQQDVAEGYEPGDKITWYHSNHHPEIEGTVVGWKDGHLIVKSIDPQTRNTEKTVAKYRVPKNNILSHNKQGVAEDTSNLPQYLYHATYRPLLKSIKKTGLGGSGAQAKWEDSKPGVTYLALDPNIAESYAETSDVVPEEWLDEIIILKISTSGLDTSKLHTDRNVQDNEGDTLEYHGVIPINNISVVKRDIDEMALSTYKTFGDFSKPGPFTGADKKLVPHTKKQDVTEESCPHCAGPMFSEALMMEKKDACYYKVKSRYKVWPSAYASGALVKCRNKGASNWGNGGKKNESSILEGIEQADESLHDWFNKEKWVRMDTKGKIKGPCAREPGEGKPKCLPQSKAHSLGKKGRASAAARKRREDPNPDRSGKAINVNTKKEKND